MGSFQSRCRAGNGLTTEDTEITEDTDRRWHSLCEWSGLKIPHPTCKHARVRLFYPPILTRQDFARQSGKQDQCVAKVGADRRDAPRFRRIPRRWVRLCRSSGSFRRNDPTSFLFRSRLRPTSQVSQVRLFSRLS